MAWGSFGLVLSGNLTLTEVAPFVNQIRDLLKLEELVGTVTVATPRGIRMRKE
jgi:hypothetical protein